MIRLIFHIVGAIQFFYGCYYDHTYVKIPSTSTNVTPFAGKLKYLTFLNAILQTVYFTIAVSNDIFGTNEPAPSHKPVLRRIKDTMFSTLAFPMALFVGVTFWGIYAVNRELILPRAMDPFFPIWLNHVMHSNIVLFTLIELATSFRMYPSKKKGLTILCTFMLSYAVWVHYIYFRTGSWVYPILNALNWPLRIAFYVFSLIFICGFYSLGENLNKLVWSKEVESTVKSGKKKAK
ncbi:androgen-induced gene 1 protein [Papilio machaon]|uniref:androgen-induced gene 1 protein n=1 Tax=Papilio machaon TaxID=76193 RepID=UPI001E663B7E|nr:androgen-induced gene 1 protein [Papilio machaon]